MMRVRGALETPDGAWRVEVLQQGREHYYRLIHGDDAQDRIVIGTLQRLLAEAGVDWPDLVETDGEPAHTDG